MVFEVVKFSLMAMAIGLFLWLVVFKFLALFIKMPCPASFSFLVDNPVRKYYTRFLIDNVGIQPDERVLELGCGPGIFSIKASNKLGEKGELISVDIQEEMIAKLEKTIAKHQVKNIRPIVASAYDMPLEDNSIDRAFLIECYPEIPDKNQALKELFRVIKPGGILSFSEEFLDPAYPLASSVIKNVEKSGFKLKERHGNFFLYTLNFYKAA